MSNERSTEGARPDEALSRAYREVAAQRAPEHLDRAVLQMAARAAKPRYARSRAWARPLAWAATIALSVAIVLEVTQDPVPQRAPIDEVAPVTDDAQATLPASPGAGSTAVEGRSADVMQSAREKSGPLQKTSAPVVMESGVAEEKREADAPAAEVQSPMGATSYAIRDEENTGRVGELRETPRPAARQALVSSESIAVSGDDELIDSDPAACPQEATGQPSTWLECIEELERAGLVDEAAEERRHLRDAFPGIELP